MFYNSNLLYKHISNFFKGYFFILYIFKLSRSDNNWNGTQISTGVWATTVAELILFNLEDASLQGWRSVHLAFFVIPQDTVSLAATYWAGPQAGASGAVREGGCSRAVTGVHSACSRFACSCWLSLSLFPFRSYSMEHRPRPAVVGVGGERIRPSRRGRLVIPEYWREGAVQDDERWFPAAHSELQRRHPSLASPLPQRE